MDEVWHKALSRLFEDIGRRLNGCEERLSALERKQAPVDLEEEVLAEFSVEGPGSIPWGTSPYHSRDAAYFVANNTPKRIRVRILAAD